LPGLVLSLDAFAILSAALITSVVLLGSYLEDASKYVAAVSFVCLVTLMLLHFAGLYQLEAIMRPIRSASRILLAFVTTILFLLAAAFSLKVSADFFATLDRELCRRSVCSDDHLAIHRFACPRTLGRYAGIYRYVVLVGSGEQARKLLANMESRSPGLSRLLAYFPMSRMRLQMP